MSFQAVGPEEPKERSPKLAVQDRGTSSLRQLPLDLDLTGVRRAFDCLSKVAVTLTYLFT